MNSNSNLSWIRTAACLGLVTITACGCYLLQSAHGQLSLMAKRRPIPSVMDAPSTPAILRRQLREITLIRDFAIRELHLPDNGSYRSYADVQRPYVVWNVVAAPEFSLEPKSWCFPVVGCVEYRGYFVEAKARKFAAKLHTRGFDVSVGGVAAYSTLGHFDDPILNTMMAWSDVELAGIVFHELTHQLLYVAGDASFNEALATTVEAEGVRRWLIFQGRESALAEQVVQQQHYRAVIALLRDSVARLRSLYASGAGPGAMSKLKHAEFDALRASYGRLKATWNGPAPFDSWFTEDLGNAHLASIGTYYDCVPGFERELAAVHGDLDVFYGRVRTLAKLARAARDAAMCQR